MGNHGYVASVRADKLSFSEIKVVVTRAQRDFVWGI